MIMGCDYQLIIKENDDDDDNTCAIIHVDDVL